MVGPRVAQQRFAAGGRDHRRKVPASMRSATTACSQPFSLSVTPLHPDVARALAFDLRAHLDQHFGGSDDLGLLIRRSRTFTIRERGGHQEIFPVPVTVTMSVRMRAPAQPRAARRAGGRPCSRDRQPISAPIVALDQLLARDQVGAAADSRRAASTQQRPEPAPRRAWSLPGRRALRYGSGRRHRGVRCRCPSRSTTTPMLRTSLSIVLTSCRRSTLCNTTGRSGQQGGAQLRPAPHSWRPKRSPRRRPATAANQ